MIMNNVVSQLPPDYQQVMMASTTDKEVGSPPEDATESDMTLSSSISSTSSVSSSRTSQRRRSKVVITTAEDQSDKVQKEQLYKVPLIPINCSFGIVTAKSGPVSFQRAMRKERKVKGADVTVVFAVRTPGCGGCREHGWQLSELARSNPGISMMGIVKETGVDDEALLDFYENYFHFPLYQDEKWNMYRAMGGRRLCRWTVCRNALRLIQRVRAKGIAAKVGKGDFWMYGGVMVFDKSGELRYTMYEKFGEEFDLEALQRAIDEASSNNKSNSSSACSSFTTTSSLSSSLSTNNDKNTTTTASHLTTTTTPSASNSGTNPRSRNHLLPAYPRSRK